MNIQAALARAGRILFALFLFGALILSSTVAAGAQGVDPGRSVNGQTAVALSGQTWAGWRANYGMTASELSTLLLTD